MTSEQTGTTLRKAAIWIGLAAGIVLAWELRPAILLGFGAVVLAIVFNLVAEVVCRLLKISRPQGFAVAIVIVVALIGLCLWLFGLNLYQQFGEVVRRIGAGQSYFNSLIGRTALGNSLLQSGGTFISDSIKSVVSTGSYLIEGFIIMLIASIYLAASPAAHRDGAAYFFPPGARPKFLRALDSVGFILKEWILGQLLLMVSVGILSTVAVALIGLPNPVPLGLLAGLTEAVPYIGPWLGAVPALLVALTVSNNFGPVILTALAYLGVHLFEGYVVGPLVQRWFVGIPPALMRLGIFSSQLIFGLPGVMLGGPMTVALFAGIKIVYLKQPVEAAEKKIRA